MFTGTEFIDQDSNEISNARTVGARRRRVTVVDDSPDIRDLLGDVLGHAGLDVSLLEGATTIDAISQSAPDLLVVDWRFAAGGLTGLEIIRQARSHPALRGVPIVVCSAAPDEVREHDEELSRMPQLSTLNKPFSLEELETCVSEALDGRPGR